jgi:hypothetical protein
MRCRGRVAGEGALGDRGGRRSTVFVSGRENEGEKKHYKKGAKKDKGRGEGRRETISHALIATQTAEEDLTNEVGKLY